MSSEKINGVSNDNQVDKAAGSADSVDKAAGFAESVDKAAESSSVKKSKCFCNHGMGVAIGAACGAIIVGASALCVACVDTMKTDKPEDDNTFTVSISASSEVTTIPDVFGLTFSIDTSNADSAEAAKENSNKCSELLKYLKDDLKIPEKDIQTTDKRLNPEYRWDSVANKQDLVGYTMSTSFKVTTEDSEVLGKIISGTPTLGVNRIGNISYEVSNYDELYNEALKLAVEKAKSKAEAIMSVTDQKVLGVVGVSESGYNPVPIAYKNVNMALDAGPEAASVDNFSVGESSISANVTVTFEVEGTEK